MSGYMYQAIFPITDMDRPMSELVAEGSACVSMMAAQDGVLITGEPEWTFSGERLICQVPARPWDAHVQSAFDPRDVSHPTSGKALPISIIDAMRLLVELGHSDSAVAERVGVSGETVRRYRKRWAIL